MKTKLLYILVSGPSDVYLEQAYVSAFSASRQNPDALLVLLTDKETAGGWLMENPLGEPFKSLFSEIVAADLPSGLAPMQRSRLLKTGMRRYVDGDFLFIDADTIVARSLADIDGYQADLAAVPDLHSPFASHPHRRATVNMCKKLGYNPSGDAFYYNSGVMLVRDTPSNHDFFRQWQENYLDGYRNGIKPDQPSLAKTAHGTSIVRLPDEWNCEVQNGVRYLRDAYIIHYMVTNIGSGLQDKLFLLNDKEVLLRMRKAGCISAEVSAVVEDPFRGYAPVTQVFAGPDLDFFRTRRYRWLRKRYEPGKFSLLEFILKVKDHICRK